MVKIKTAQLHCHTKYSIQDAMPSAKDYVNKIYEHNQKSTKYETIGIATSDHGVVHGIVDQYNACNNPDHKERKIKAIYAMEAYHCYDVDNNPNHERFHLVLIAKNNTGLKNLYQIASHAGMHIYQGKQKKFPITDIKFLEDHGEGIIALSACIGGLIPKLILKGDSVEATRIAVKFQNIFDEFYFELQPNELPEQLIVNQELIDLGQVLNIPLVMTSDSHYLDASDSKYHDILKDINHQLKFTINAHMYTPEEMEEYCLKYNIPLDCISNSGVIAEKCNADPKPKSNRELLPVFPVPAGYTEDSYLRKMSFKGLKDRMIKKRINDPVKYIKTMLYELDVICNAGYAGYFLILWDWFEWCRNNGILTGPGRGSAAGSIVSYALNITKVDPIKNGFFFERFLNPGRLSFPDIDELKVA